MQEIVVPNAMKINGFIISHIASLGITGLIN